MSGQLTPTSLGQSVRMFRSNLPSALLTEWLGSFTCQCGNTGVERTSNKTQHTKLTMEKKILVYQIGIKLFYTSFDTQVLKL